MNNTPTWYISYGNGHCSTNVEPLLTRVETKGRWLGYVNTYDPEDSCEGMSSEEGMSEEEEIERDPSMIDMHFEELYVVQKSELGEKPQIMKCEEDCPGIEIRKMNGIWTLVIYSDFPGLRFEVQLLRTRTDHWEFRQRAIYHYSEDDDEQEQPVQIVMMNLRFRTGQSVPVSCTN